MAKQVAESKRLYLELLNVTDHLESYHSLYSDEQVSRWSHRPPITSLSEAKSLMLSRLPSPESPWIENYAIMAKDGKSDRTDDPEMGGRMVGVIGILYISHDGLAAEVGYGILASEWGKGFASEALSLFTEYYFNSAREFQKEVLVAQTEPENAASGAVLAKAGFKRGELVRGAFEATDLVTGKERMWDAFPWRYERSRLELD